MKAAVCVKQVDGELNPFDACALESALGMENAEITVVSMGKPQVADMLKALTRLGVHRAILLSDAAFAGADTLATSYVLALALKKIDPDLVICGRQSVDGDTAQVGPCLSQMLGCPLITNVMRIHSVSDKITCSSRMGEESVMLPALITVEKINTLRFPSIRAKAKEIEIWTAEDINADKDRCGLKGSPTRVLDTYESNAGKRKCVFIRPDELLAVVRASRNKIRSEIETRQSSVKFDEVWTVGEGLEQAASAIARKVKSLGKASPEIVAKLASEHKPEVILWNSDLWGRRNAPIAAAMLNTGLCADCTLLETDGKRLYMYRPAYGGSLIAKVECRTQPQMATVRTAVRSGEDIIVAGGKGAIGSFDLMKEFAEKIGAGIGASRGLVDTGLAPYEIQIGLTGRNVCPKVYIACGISGSVQHTCAIEQAGTVIAINRDKNARIFEYADYGIVGDVGESLEATAFKAQSF